MDEYYGGPAGIGNKNIIGFCRSNGDASSVSCVPMLTVRLRARHMSDIDDDWGNMNKNGPSEMNGNAMEDMGLGPADLAEIVPA